MITDIQIIERKPVTVAQIRRRISPQEIETEMQKAIECVVKAIELQGFSPQGPLFANYFEVSEEFFEFDVGFPVSQAFRKDGDVSSDMLNGGKAVRALYKGAYEGLYAAWQEFTLKIEELDFQADGLKLGETGMEVYLAGPEAVADEAAYETELSIPLLPA